MAQTFQINAVAHNGGYRHFGIHPITASLYGDDKSAIVTLLMGEHEDQTRPTFQEEKERGNDGTYWGWVESDINELSLVYSALFLVDICFPGGYKASEDRGRGRVCRLTILKVV